MPETVGTLIGGSLSINAQYVSCSVRWIQLSPPGWLQFLVCFYPCYKSKFKCYVRQ